MGTVKMDRVFFHPWFRCMEHEDGVVSNHMMYKLRTHGFNWPILFEVPPELTQAGLSTDPTSSEGPLVEAKKQQPEDPNAEPEFLQPIYLPPLLDQVMRMPDHEAKQLMGMTKDQFLVNLSNHHMEFYTDDPAKVTPKNQRKQKSSHDDPRRVFRSLPYRLYVPREIFIAVVLGVIGSSLLKVFQWYWWNEKEEYWAEYYASNEEPEAEIIQKLYEQLDQE